MPLPRTRRSRWGAIIATASVAALAGVGLASPVAAQTTIPGVDEERSSSNVDLLQNTPKSGPFAGVSAFETDLAFQGDYAYQGNYEGFTVWDLSDPEAPVQATQVVCPGSQNDVSVTGDLLFLSTDSRRSDDSCSSTSTTDPANYWEGMKIFDISDPASPQYVKAVETDCGSHTHTLVPGETEDVVYLYVSSYSPSATLAKCQPPHDKISVIEVPVGDPTAAAVVDEPVVFPDGGNPGGNGSSTTSGCHDITVYPAKDLAAGACMGDGVLWDITDRSAPREISRVQDLVNFAFWHSATFNNEGTKVVFTDELGGGGAATCVPTIADTRGANGIYDVTGEGDGRELEFASYYKIPRDNTQFENCVAHNGSLVPVAGRDIMVQSWYQGGISVWEFTDSGAPVELGYFERGPLSNEALILGGTWSAYYYNGYVYSSDIQKGFDVLELSGRDFARANAVKYDELNAQTQPVFDPRSRTVTAP